LVSGAAMADGRIPSRLQGPEIDALDRARDWSYPGIGGYLWRPADFAIFPIKGSGRATRKALFLGDSHVEQYWARVARVLSEHPDAPRSAEFVTHGGCLPLPGVSSVALPSQCSAFVRYALERVSQDDVDTVVIGGFWEKYLLGEYGVGSVEPVYLDGDLLRVPLRLGDRNTNEVLLNLTALIGRLVRSGRRVYIVLSSPTSPRFMPTSRIPAAVRLGLRAPAAIALSAGAVDLADFKAFVSPVTRALEQVAAATGAQLLDPAESLCDAGRCPVASSDGRAYYCDSHHARTFYARTRASFIDAPLLAASPAPAAGPVLAAGPVPVAGPDQRQVSR
jgi:hypothetical protein